MVQGQVSLIVKADQIHVSSPELRDDEVVSVILGALTGELSHMSRSHNCGDPTCYIGDMSADLLIAINPVLDKYAKKKEELDRKEKL